MSLAVSMLTLFVAAPLALALGQRRLRRARYRGVAREFHAGWSRRTPAQKREALARVGVHCLPDTPEARLDDTAHAFFASAWDELVAARLFDFELLRERVMPLAT